MRFVISRHAREEMIRRQISEIMVTSVLANPQQIVDEYGGKKAYQSRIAFGEGKTYLLRVIVNEDVDPAVAVTVYRTSKIEKYWRKS